MVLEAGVVGVDGVVAAPPSIFTSACAWGPDGVVASAAAHGDVVVQILVVVPVLGVAWLKRSPGFQR